MGGVVAFTLTFFKYMFEKVWKKYEKSFSSFFKCKFEKIWIADFSSLRINCSESETKLFWSNSSTDYATIRFCWIERIDRQSGAWKSLRGVMNIDLKSIFASLKIYFFKHSRYKVKKSNQTIKLTQSSKLFFKLLC